MNRKNSGNEEIEIVKEIKANRKYKDTVFRMLFSNKERLLELYNAVSGKHYDDVDGLEIVTLENAVYMGMKNDLAFIMDTNLYLYEHQSTVNPNMPLRDLFYISAEYSELVDIKSLYTPSLIKLPTPNFIVFYNGEADTEDVSEYRLSDSFMTPVDDRALELRVRVFNVNYGRNVKLMEQCGSLREYAQYVALVRRYKKETGSLDDGVRLAIEQCIREGILEEFLRKNRSEVEMTSIFEYNKEEEDRKLYQAGVEQGIEQGIEQTKKKMACSLLKDNIPLEKVAKLLEVKVSDIEKWKPDMK